MQNVHGLRYGRGFVVHSEIWSTALERISRICRIKWILRIGERSRPEQGTRTAFWYWMRCWPNDIADQLWPTHSSINAVRLYPFDPLNPKNPFQRCRPDMHVAHRHDSSRHTVRVEAQALLPLPAFFICTASVSIILRMRRSRVSGFLASRMATTCSLRCVKASA